MSKRQKMPGTFLPRIEDESPQYPVEEFGTFNLNDCATSEEMVAAGFPQADMTGLNLVDPDGNWIDADQLVFPVLRDKSGRIVASWDEERWWTPYESARLTQQYVREFKNSEGWAV